MSEQKSPGQAPEAADGAPASSQAGEGMGEQLGEEQHRLADEPGSESHIEDGAHGTKAAAATSAGSAEKAAVKGSGWRNAGSWALTVLIAIALAAGVRAFVAESFYVPSESMSSTLEPGDRIVAEKITGHVSGIQRGDVIVFHDPGNWLEKNVQDEDAAGSIRKALAWVGLSSGEDNELVKRVVGVAGDTISCCDVHGNLLVNGWAVDESSYTHGTSDQVTFEITVPEGMVWVMGDNRDNSADSRFHMNENGGFVPVEKIIGRAGATIWPLGRAQTLDRSGPLSDPALDTPASG